MSRLIRTLVAVALVVVFGVVSRAQNAPKPSGAGPAVAQPKVPSTRPAECAPYGINAQAIAPDPDCTMANHPLTPNEKGGTGETGPYTVVPNHFKPDFPKGWTWGRVGGIFAESPDRVYVYISGINPVEDAKPWGGILRILGLAPGALTPPSTRREYILTIFDRTGKQIGMFKEADAMKHSTPHRVRVSPWDPEKHVWLVDEGGTDQILKFTRDGKFIMKVQTKGSTGPSDIAFLPNGDFYAVQRGRNDEQVLHFSKDGKEIRRLGVKGSTFDAHCLAFDKRGRMYVGDMYGERIQVYDASGKLVDTWPNIRQINFCAMDKNEHLWVFDSDSMAFLKYDLNGRLLFRWGTLGTYPGRLMNINQFHVDSEGNLYTASPVNWRPQLFRPKKGAKPSELIPQLLQ